MDEPHCFYGMRPSKNYRGGFRRDVRSTVDANDDLYSVYWTSQIFVRPKGKTDKRLFAGKGPIAAPHDSFKTSKSDALLNMTFGALTDILWDGDLGNKLISPKVLSSAILEDKPVTEGLWLVDHIGPKKGLLLLSGENLIPIVPGIDRTTGFRDGHASVMPGQSQATLKNAITICRLSRPALVILEADPLRIRMLDLTTWEVTTILNAMPSHLGAENYYSLHHFPEVKKARFTNALSVSKSNSYVQLFSRHHCETHLLDLEAGKFVDKRQVAHFPSHNYAVPVASSVNAPTFLMIDMGLSLATYSSTNKNITTRNLPCDRDQAHAYVTQLWRPDMTYSDIAELIPAGTSKPRLFGCDLSFLIDSPLFPGDVKLENLVSGRTWQVPSEVLLDLYPKLSLDKLRTVVKQTSFPVASVDAFIARLFNKRLVKEQMDPKYRICYEMCWLWQEVGLPHVDWVFASTVSHFPATMACDALLHLWSDKTIERRADDPILRSLAMHIKNHCKAEFAAMMASESTSRTNLLDIYVWSQEGSIPCNVEVGLSRVEIEDFRLTGSQHAPNLITPLRPFDFVFSLEEPNDLSFAVMGDTRYMYANWGWFRRLWNDNEYHREKQTRSTVMPHWMTSDMLMAILECVHGTLWTTLSVKDSLTLLEHRHDLILMNDKDQPLWPFGRLVNRAIELCFPIVGDSGAIEQLAKLVELKLGTRADQVMDAIVASSSSFDLAAALELLTIGVLASLKAKFKAVRLL